MEALLSPLFSKLSETIQVEANGQEAAPNGVLPETTGSAYLLKWAGKILAAVSLLFIAKSLWEMEWGWIHYMMKNNAVPPLPHEMRLPPQTKQQKQR